MVTFLNETFGNEEDVEKSEALFYLIKDYKEGILKMWNEQKYSDETPETEEEEGGSDTKMTYEVTQAICSDAYSNRGDSVPKMMSHGPQIEEHPRYRERGGPKMMSHGPQIEEHPRYRSEHSHSDEEHSQEVE